MAPPDNPIHRYHDGSKHHFNRFAPSLGYLDWASQPSLFRSFSGAPTDPLYPAPGAADPGYVGRPTDYDDLFKPSSNPQALSAGLVGDVLRHALGLSAWKAFGRSRWSLRANPSSGNLHPTEAYVVCGSLAGLADTPAVYHYAAEHHALERRCAFDEEAWVSATEGRDVVLIVLTSIHWREAWKYGERAFRYCQHDLGHAIGALALAATMVGWQARLLPSWSHRSIASLAGIDRGADYVDREREEPGALLALVPDALPVPLVEGAQRLVPAVQHGRWFGLPSQLSEDHVQWTFIDEIARETEDPGRTATAPHRDDVAVETFLARGFEARVIALQRRSALAFDGVSSIGADTFFRMLARVMPVDHSPWNALWWTPTIHLFVFVHRIEGLAAGLYLLGRQSTGFERLLESIGPAMVVERAHGVLPLVCLARGDCRSMARRLSCDQDIASDGFFSLGMIAEFDGPIAEHGPSFYRHLFWESGVVGQVLYLEAEAAGARATGIGCFYDDPVHQLLGLKDHAFQSLYHFTVGMPVEDLRLTTERGYRWEK